jgi:outer membrane protein
MQPIGQVGATILKEGCCGDVMKITLPLLALLVLTPAAPASAQAQDPEYRRVRVGLGAQVRPEFVGGKDLSVAPLFDVDLANGGEEYRVESPDDSFGLRVLRLGKLSLGPAAGIDSSRKDKDVGAPVGRIKTTIKLGGFADFEPSDSFRVHAELLKGVNGHEGLTGAVGADHIWRDGDRYVFTLGPRLLFSDAKYQRAFFGVTPAAALATGLPVYRPGSGIHAVALAGGMTTQLSGPWSLFGYARGERLVGDAAKSPIVREYGSRNQLSAGLGLAYEFRIKR